MYFRRVPNFFTEDSLSPSSSSFVPSPPKKVEKAPRPSLSAPQYHMLSILDSICGYKDETGRVLADRFKKLPSKIVSLFLLLFLFVFRSTLSIMTSSKSLWI